MRISRARVVARLPSQLNYTDRSREKVHERRRGFLTEGIHDVEYKVNEATPLYSRVHSRRYIQNARHSLMRLRALVSARVQEAAAIILQIISPQVHAILLKITRLRRRTATRRTYNTRRPSFSRTCAHMRPHAWLPVHTTPIKDARGSRGW